MDVKEFKKRLLAVPGKTVMIKGKGVHPDYNLSIHRQLLTVLKGHVGAK